MREVVARRIIDMAQRGTRDQKELANGAVRFLAANYRLEHKRTAVAPATHPEITRTDIGESVPVPQHFGLACWKCRTAERISAAPYGFGTNMLSRGNSLLFGGAILSRPSSGSVATCL
jgi:hypothetical protein